MAGLMEILYIIGTTFLPFLELRFSIPYGILVADMSWSTVFIIAVLSNIALAFLVWFILNYVIHIFLRIRWIDKIWQKYIERTQHKIHSYVEKYGVLGLALFIGIPLPGSGVYSGGVAAYILGYEFEDYIKASVIGVLIAAIIVTVVVMTGSSLIGIFAKI